MVDLTPIQHAHETIDLMDGSDLASLAADLPVVGVVFTALALLLFAIAAVIFVVPALVFVAELLLIVALGLLGRVVLGRPWTVEARERGADYAYEWKTRGWRASGDLRESVAQQLEATGVPTGGTRVPPPATAP